MVAGVTGIVLCGGSGRRFQGRDKPLEMLKDKPLVAHVVERVKPQVDHLIISANRNRGDYQQFGFPVVADDPADRGPLAGVLAAARLSDSDFLFVCAGDSPLLPRSLVDILHSRLMEDEQGRIDVAVPHDGERAQHLFMLMRRSMASSIGPYLDQGGRSVGGWLSEHRVALCPVTDHGAFTNVNTPPELAVLSARWQPAAK